MPKRYQPVIPPSSAPLQDQTLADIEQLIQQADQLRQSGKYDEALSLAQQAVTRYEQITRLAHPLLAASFNLLAEIYRGKGDYGQAEPLYRKSLEIKEKVFGPDHPETAADLNNFDVDQFIDRHGNALVEILKSMFMVLKPTKNVTKYIHLAENLHNEESVKMFQAFDYWVNDAVAVPGETFRKFIKDTYQQNLFRQSKMKLGRKLIKLKNVTCPLVNVVAEHDDIVPLNSSTVVMDLVGSQERRTSSERRPSRDFSWPRRHQNLSGQKRWNGLPNVGETEDSQPTW